jgi:hypothetical protein
LSMISCAATDWTGGLAVRIIFCTVFCADFDAARDEAMEAACALCTDLVEVVLPTGLRADFDAVLSELRALLATGFAPFLTARRTGLADRLADFVDCLLMPAI